MIKLGKVTRVYINGQEVEIPYHDMSSFVTEFSRPTGFSIPNTPRPHRQEYILGWCECKAPVRNMSDSRNVCLICSKAVSA